MAKALLGNEIRRLIQRAKEDINSLLLRSNTDVQAIAVASMQFMWQTNYA